MKNTYNSTGTQKTCTVMAVDIVRKVCKCLSDSGEILSEVKWVVPMGGTDGNGLSFHPVENSRVLVDTASGFPFIIGAIPADGTKDVVRPNIGRQSVSEEDIADYSTVNMGDIIRDPGTPRDQRPGDNVMTSDGGGILGLLQSGTAVIKSSPLAQIITSRFGDVVRVVSRNWEHFTDVDETYKTSVRGKTYSLRNIFKNPSKSRSELPSKTRYEGDVAFGETLGKDYASIKEGEFPTDPLIPEDIDKVVKEYTYNEADEKTSTHTQSIVGDMHRTINTPDESSTSVQDESSMELKKSVTGGIKTNWYMNENEFHWDVNEGGTFIKGNSDGVVINVEGNVVINCSADGTLTITNTGNTEVTTDGTLGITAQDTKFNLANCTFDTSGTTTFNSAGNFVVSAPTIQLN
ncbi:hypothetical protein VPHD148_0289 [Vibrio phage D148]